MLKLAGLVLTAGAGMSTTARETVQGRAIECCAT